MPSAQTEALLREMFEVYDLDSSGDISEREYTHIMSQLRPPSVTERDWKEQTSESFAGYDTNKDGKMSFNEFRSMWINISASQPDRTEERTLQMLSSFSKHISSLIEEPALEPSAASATPNADLTGLIVDVLATTTSAIIAAILVAPAYPVKRAVAILQAGTAITDANLASRSLQYPRAAPFRGAWHVMKFTHALVPGTFRGFAGQFRGMPVSIVNSALGYPLASEIARPISSWIRKHPLAGDFDANCGKFGVLAINWVAGAAGGLATMPLTLPLYISTVLTQVDCRRPHSAVPNVGGFTNAVGFASNPGAWWYYLTRVTPLYGCGIIMYRGAQFGLNDTIMAFNPYAKEYGVVAIASKFAAAQVAVSTAGFLAYPFTTLKTRLIIAGSLTPKDLRPSSPFQCAAQIVKESGFKGFWRGFPANLFLGITSSVGMVAYGEYKLAMERAS